MTAPLKRSRREFMLDALAIVGGGAGVAATVASLGGFGRSATAVASNTSGYRALVCIYLSGGNDSFNLVVPTDNAGHAAYATARQNLAVDQGSLLGITPRTRDGHTYGFHPRAPELQSLFASGQLAIQANVGPLLTPTTQSMFRSGINIPPILFSHADQALQWMTGRPESRAALGWGGQVADLLQGGNAASGLSMNISYVGDNVFQTGNTVLPYSINPGTGVQTFAAVSSGSPSARATAFQALMGQASTDTNAFEQQLAGSVAGAESIAGYLSGVLATAPTLNTSFPQTSLGQQLRAVAQMISVRSTLGMSRQVFFVAMDGFDTHFNQLATQPQLFADLSQAINAFYAATVEMNVANGVTSFTMSDFGRTLTSNNGGTDHGWGGHHLVVGGAVNGGDIYGTMPNLSIGGPDDSDGNGRIIPSTSVYQYSAALATWLGADPADIETLYPNLRSFPAGIPNFITA